MNARKEEMKTGRMDVFIEARRNKKQQTCGRTYGRKEGIFANCCNLRTHDVEADDDVDANAVVDATATTC